MIRQAIVTLLALAVGTALAPQTGQGDAPRQTQAIAKPAALAKIDELMKHKLEHAQKVLEGVAINDFDKIRTHAEDLIRISKQAEFIAYQTPEYELSTGVFRRSAQDLVQKAKDKNLDGAALAYLELTLSCVKCHKYVRDTRRVQLTPSRQTELWTVMQD